MMSYSILDNINSASDIKELSYKEIESLCDDIRAFLVEKVGESGGHLASNLGVTELSVALHRVFDSPKDHIIFDVGHQSYVHKLLTGRQAAFDRLRQFGGIAGFPKPSESDTDAFVAGHASSSVSIALGMARARTLLSEDYSVIALIGDGAATGGMVYEGLNDASQSKEPLIVILNDNEMSIDRNVGGMSHHLSNLRTKERYLGMKQHYRDALSRIPGGRKLYEITSSIKNWIKRSILPTTIFENMGMTYLGPVDGHDLPELIRLLKVAKRLRSPVLLHVLTQKGHGYLPAEEQPSKFHGVGRFDPLTGESVSSASRTFSDAFGDSMCRLAQENDRICAITAAMPGGTGLLQFKKQYPTRLFDVGIAEEHAVSMAGGLAKQGMIPVVAIYSTFLQRSFDQIMQDVSMLNLHVIFAVDRAGLVGEDGETHHGVFDVGFLRQIPNMTVLCPCNCKELDEMLTWAVKECTGPVAIRYPRGGDGTIKDSAFDGADHVVCHKAGTDAAILTYGTTVNTAVESAEALQADGINAAVFQLQRISPLPVEQIVSALGSIRDLLIVEEASSDSAIHQALTWELRKHLPDLRINAMDLGGGFITHGALVQLRNHIGIDADGVTKKFREVCGHEN